jgi:hypothetical protein
LNEDSVVALGLYEYRGDEGSRYGEDGEDIPGALAETMPRQTNDADNDVGDKDYGQDEEDIV